MKIRIATQNDLETLFDFEQQLIAHERPLDLSLIQGEKILYYDLPTLMEADDSEVFVAEIDGSIVGSGFGKIEENKPKFTEKRYGYIGFIFVRKEFRRQGIAEKIVSHLFDWFKERGLNEALLKVYDGNTGAIKAYEKIGFQSGLIEMKINLKDQT